MASHYFNYAKAVGAGEGTRIDWDADTIKCIPMMTNTTADTEYEVETVSAITTPDYMDGTGFTWTYGGDGNKDLSGSLAITDVTGAPGVGYAKIDATDVTWATLGAGTRAIQGILIYKDGGSYSASVPLCFVDFASDFTANGGDLTVAWHADGLVKYGFNA